MDDATLATPAATPRLRRTQPDPTADDGLDEEPSARSAEGIPRLALRDGRFRAGLLICGTVALLALLAPALAPHDPIQQFREGLPASGEPAGPGPGFFLGRDVSGRDELSQLLWGARASLVIGLVSSAASSAIGLAVGIVAVHAGTRRVGVGRWRVPVPVEELLMRLTDLALAFPALLLALALGSVASPSIALTIGVITLSLWATVARLVYARARTVRQSAYLEAAHALGSPGSFVLRRHYLPQVLPLVAGWAALGVGTAIVFEATLSFLGVGVPSATPTWGRMIDTSIQWYQRDPRLLLLPGLALVVTVVGFGLIGEAVADAADPRRRAGRGPTA